MMPNRIWEIPFLVTWLWQRLSGGWGGRGARVILWRHCVLAWPRGRTLERHRQVQLGLAHFTNEKYPQARSQSLLSKKNKMRKLMINFNYCTIICGLYKIRIFQDSWKNTSCLINESSFDDHRSDWIVSVSGTRGFFTTVGTKIPW